MAPAIKVAFRFYEEDQTWEALGINVAAYGQGDSLAEARKDFLAALDVLLDDVDPADVYLEEYIERCARPETEHEPAVWVREYKDHDPKRMLMRRSLAELVKETLVNNPAYMKTFDDRVSTFGDIIAVATFEDDLLYDVLDQIGESKRLFIGTPRKDGHIYWQCLLHESQKVNGDGSKPVTSLGLSDASTVGDLYDATMPAPQEAKNILAPA